MYFLLAMACALIGMGLVIHGTPVKSSAKHHPFIDTDHWIESTRLIIQTWIRRMLKFIVVHLVNWYRYVTRDITIHKTMKQKVRELLYEHYRENKNK
jgi:hypothetical protein